VRLSARCEHFLPIEVVAFVLLAEEPRYEAGRTVGRAKLRIKPNLRWIEGIVPGTGELQTDFELPVLRYLRRVGGHVRDARLARRDERHFVKPILGWVIRRV